MPGGSTRLADRPLHGAARPAPEGRIVLDFETILGVGWMDLIARSQAKIAEASPTPARSRRRPSHFWRAAIRVLEATKTWARNYGRAADAKAENEADPVRRAELRTIAPLFLFGRTPQSFPEALQHSAGLCGRAPRSAHLGLFRRPLDRYLYPYSRPTAGAES